MSSAATLGGWATAGLTTLVVVAVRRALDTRMEAVARACHELRGPITAARLGLSLGSRTGELSAARLRAIDSELSRAALALDDLAEMRRSGAGGLRLRELSKVDVAALVTEAVVASRGRAVAAGTDVAGGWNGPRAAVWGDRLRLAQALGNLIANAIEHGAGRVGVGGTVRDGMVRVEVRDGGSGLPAPVAVLAARPRRGRGARGRGLAIALAVAQAHGGTVTAAPSPDGARVVLELPAATG